MSNLIRVIGVDPGPMPGIVCVDYVNGRPATPPTVAQCSWAIALDVVRLLAVPDGIETYVGVERFRMGNKRPSAAGALTADLVGKLLQLCEGLNVNRAPGYQVYAMQRPATDVKTWATDKRLQAAGLWDPTAGMRHARDGARHMLYTAVHDGLAIDPLSRKAARDG